jgi:hypothetical protein
MMEFFLSKIWAFLVSIVLIGVLIQGVQIDARYDRGQALDEMADGLERLFRDFASAGEGMEWTLHLNSILPATATLSIFLGWAILAVGGHEVRILIPVIELLLEDENGQLHEAEALMLDPTCSLMMCNDFQGTTVMALSP